MDLEELGRRWEESLARQQRTSLSRTIDPRMRSNVVALGISILAGMAVLAARLAGGIAVTDSVLDSFGAGLAVFLTWALARELDPDHHSSAVAAELGALVLWYWLPSSPGLLFATLIAARLIVRSTGRAPTRADLILAVLVAGGAIAIVATSLEDWSEPGLSEWVLLGVGGLSIPLLGVRAVHARADYTGEPLDVRRVRAARATTALIALVGFGIAGGLGVSRMAGVWAALISVPVTKMIRRTRR